VQQFFDLKDGSALKLTTAHYYTPSGRSITGTGITPDVFLGERGSAGPQRDLATLLVAHGSVPDWVAADTELHVAVATLQDPAGVRAWFDSPESGEPNPVLAAPTPEPAPASSPAAR
jgi:C-terminal processing protease CtpA/Prc